MLKSLLLFVGVTVAVAVAAPAMLSRESVPDAGRPDVAARPPQPARVVDDRPGAFSVRADPDGHFRVEASIGGRRVPMLVDTGATVVALSFEEGQRLGLASANDRFDVRVSTANGAVGAKRVLLRDLRVGGVGLSDVEALVLTRGALDGALLGMSFLGRLKRMETSRDRLTLER